jgi:hypothetical protein
MLIPINWQQAAFSRKTHGYRFQSETKEIYSCFPILHIKRVVVEIANPLIRKAAGTHIRIFDTVSVTARSSVHGFSADFHPRRSAWAIISDGVYIQPVKFGDSARPTINKSSTGKGHILSLISSGQILYGPG